MAYPTALAQITLNGTGTEIPPLNTTDGVETYLLTGTVITTGNYAIVSTGTPQIGTTYIFNYNGSVTLGLNTFQIFSTIITQAQLFKKWKAVCVYNGTSWDVSVFFGLNQSNVISSDNIGNVIVDANIVNASINLGTKGIALSLDTTKIAALAVTTAKIDNLAVTGAKLATDSVTTIKVLDANVTNAKLATMANNTIKGNISGGVASPSDIAISSLINTNAWSLTGNSGTTAGTNFVGTTDAADLVFKIAGVGAGRITVSGNNTSYGSQSLAANTFGTDASAFGYTALYSNTTGLYNTAVGSGCLYANTSGTFNTGIGINALNLNTTGGGNTGIGEYALSNLTIGGNNTGVGGAAGSTLTTGGNNTIIGHGSDVSSATSVNRIALGYGAAATLNYQFAIPTNVTHINFALNTHVKGATLISDGAGIGTWATTTVDTTAGDAATINKIAGRFRKDVSGTTFTLTNSYITTGSVIILTNTTTGITAGNQLSVVAGSGSAVITFETNGVAAAPNANMDVNFWIIN